jgi:hypothetical protein
MRNLILTLATTLALVTLCEAGSRPRTPPSHLTLEETLCYAFGETTYDLAIARDSGMSVLEAISSTRRGVQGPLSTPPMRQFLTEVVQAIYEYRTVKPEAVREAYTLACLKDHIFAATPSSPTVAKDRY